MNRNGTNTLPLHIHDDNNGLDYTLHGDYYLPDLEVPKAPPLNRWGRMAFDKLQNHHPGRFTRMLLDGSLYPYCHDIGQQTQERFDVLMQGYQRCWGDRRSAQKQRSDGVGRTDESGEGGSGTKRP